MTEIRCKKCNRLLMKADAVRAEIKCGKCGFVNRVDHNIIQIGEGALGLNKPIVI